MNKHSYYDKYKRDKKSQTFYRSSEWRKCRELALKRDNYLCVRCLAKKKLKKADLVHHIKELRDHPDLGLILDNLESLCNQCHNEHHKVVEGKEVKVSEKVSVVKVSSNREMW